MGLYRKNSNCCYKICETIIEVPVGNPNPTNWEIIDSLQIGKCLIVEIKYPDCKNYEGKKILVYENINLGQLKDQKQIDPHFYEGNRFISPIARFEPTSRGWRMATIFIRGWNTYGK